MIQFDVIRAHDPELCGYMEEELARRGMADDGEAQPPRAYCFGELCE